MFASFWTQFKALTKKNLRLLVLRHWISTLLLAAVIPVLISALTLNINNFGSSSGESSGVGTPRQIRSIKEGIGSQRLVTVRPPHLASEVDTVIQVCGVRAR